jgi:hypothetical protein
MNRIRRGAWAYDHVRGRVEADFVDLGERQLKNIARAVRVYTVRPGSESAAPAPSVSVPNKEGPPRLSIVVLPFANIGDPEQEHFVDGVTESLTTDLSRIRGALVIDQPTGICQGCRPKSPRRPHDPNRKLADRRALSRSSDLDHDRFRREPMATILATDSASPSSNAAH